jgi:hypothetical protein
MSSISSASGLITSIEQAEKDLAMYAAIIGCKPTVEQTAPTTAPIAEALSTESSHDDAHHPRRMSIWMRHVSDEAKKRIHEAKLRLAS